MSSEQERRLDEMLGAYALDAVSEEERREIEEYLAMNPRARAEVEEHREVATLLGWTGAAAPEGLWERIAAQLDDMAPTPSGELASVLALDPSAERRSSGASRREPRRARRPATRVVAGWLGAAAAAVVVAVAITAAVVGRDDDGDPLMAAVEEVRRDERSSVAMLMSGDVMGGEAVIGPDGRGFFLSRDLPPLPPDRTYQLWGVMDGKAISLGVFGPDPDVEMFSAEGPLTQLVLTNEVAGGVVSDGNAEGAYAATLG